MTAALAYVYYAANQNIAWNDAVMTLDFIHLSFTTVAAQPDFAQGG